jgi:hypothetical protein
MWCATLFFTVSAIFLTVGYSADSYKADTLVGETAGFAVFKPPVVKFAAGKAPLIN